MSLHSTRSNRTGRTAGGRSSVSDAQVYQYALRVAYLSYLMRPKPIAAPVEEDSSPSSSSSHIPSAADTAPKGHTARLQEAFKMPDFTSMFVGGMGSSSSSSREGKSSKFPEKTIKVLDEKLRSIFMGKDPAFQDQRIRRTVATFWSNTSDPAYLRGVRENRKIEELILMFVSVATKELQKEVRQLQEKKVEPDFDWKYELNVQVGQIVRILRETLKNVSGVSPELTAKLDMYSDKLASAPKPPPPAVAEAAPVAAIKRKDVLAKPRPESSINSNDPSDMPMVQVVGQLFGKSHADLTEDIINLRTTCTEKSAMVDLKTCLKNINGGLAFPGRREDFDSEEAWQSWRGAEVSHLSQLVMIMVQFNPELAKQTPSTDNPSDRTASRPESIVDRPTSIYNQFTSNGNGGASTRHSSVRSAVSVDVDAVVSGVEGDDEIQTGKAFTFIPSNPRGYYKRLLEICIDRDLDEMVNLPEDQEVVLTILSNPHIDLTNECAMRWRVGHPYRSSAFLDVIRHKYERDEVPIECLPEAMVRVTNEIKKNPLQHWMWQDSGYLLQILNTLWDHFLRVLHAAFDDFTKVKAVDIQPYISVLEDLRETQLVGRRESDDHKLDEIADHIRQRAFSMYSTKTTELFSMDGDNEVEPLMMIIDWVEKQAKLFKKRFPTSILSAIDIVAIVLGQQVPLLLQDLEEAHPRLLEAALGTAQSDPKVDVDEVFGLYRRSVDIVSMHDHHCPDSGVSFDLGSYFEPYVRKWLATTDGLTAKWVAEAIRVDNFEPEGNASNSSSIVDLFGSFSSALDFLYGLEWPDAYQEARFLTALSKTLSKVLDQYCNAIEEMFLSEMFPREPVDPSVPKENAWIVKAKLTLQGEKKIEPFNFIPASCVKLNNVETARNELDRMYKKMGVDEVTDIIESSAPPVPTKEASQRFLFTVKIVLAEGLVATDRNPASKLDTFVTLSDQHGRRLAKTRTIYETLDPRWDQTFDISVEKDLWLMATVRDRALIGKHDEIGRAYVRLDPRRYGDFLTHEVWYDLEEKTGRLLLRISMEGEKDEIGFYFGRAFRSLKRAESDMIRTFVDKMSPMIRQSLTRGVIKALVKSTVAPVDYNETINKLTDRFRSAIGTSNEPLIPLPKDEKPALVRPKGLTDVDIEAAINPLLDYFDVNQATLSNSLSLSALQAVMGKTWKEILATLEGLLIPPLSAAPTDMTPLSDKEVDIVMKWREFLRDYFHAQGDEKGLSKETLHNQKYNDLMSIRLHYDWSTDALMEQCVRDSQASLRKAGTMRRAKSVFQSKNLGTIKDRKREKKKKGEEGGNAGNADIIMRILRMRPGSAVSEFISQQIQFKEVIAQQAQVAPQPKLLQRPSGTRKSKYGSGGGIPPVPTLPSVPSGGYQLRD